MTRVKICGIQTEDDALLAIEAGASALGFIFYPSSKRRADPEVVRKVAGMMPPFIQRVGVFVDEERRRVEELAEYCRLDVLQFHGDEDPGYCLGWRQAVIKAVRVKDAGILEGLGDYPVNALLLDTYKPGIPGGTGETFDWNLALKAKGWRKPIILAGGLTPDNVAEAVRQVRPFAVDVAGGVETAGRKDAEKCRAFVREVRRADLED